MKYLKWRGHAKDILLNYRANRQLLQQLRGDVILGQNYALDTVCRRSGVSDPCYGKAVRLSQGRLEQMGKEVAAVERVLAAYQQEKDADKLAMIRMVYLNSSHTLYGAAAVLGYSDRTLLRWNQELLSRLALELGWI
ncbi:MAG: hypothetical protein K6B40_05390 [Firmicutes bacterium]|nr:hypothetical protein [Bacillota bacterium]